MAKHVRVRFAPSPTGFLHIGNLRTILYNWLFARHHEGKFILRVEDTDRTRLVEGAKERMYQELLDMGLEPDEGYTPQGDKGDFGPYIQSVRRDKHLAYAYELIKNDRAYYCFCTEEEHDKQKQEARSKKQVWKSCDKCRDMDANKADSMASAGEPHVIRLKTPESGVIKMHDLVRGEIDIEWEQVDDQILIKTDGYPTYHLAATCDDHDMEITHVIRGEEWISSLPKHIYIYESFGWEVPKFAHLPLLLNPDKTKLSKRQGDVAVQDYLKKGYLPAALLNFVALLGWNPTADREIYTTEELVEMFEIEKVNKSGAVFNIEKLDWMNGEYLKSLDDEAYVALALPFLSDIPGDEDAKKRASIVFKNRVSVLSELQDLVPSLLASAEAFPAEKLVWKKSTKEEAKSRLEGVRELIEDWNDTDFEAVEIIEEKLLGFIKEKGWGNGDTLWPLRVALSGVEKSPSPFEYLFVFQKEESLRRIDKAVAMLTNEQ